MNPERTEIEWMYTPADLFEVPYKCETSEYELGADSGRVCATLRVPQDPIGAEVEQRLVAHVEAIFRVRQLQVHRRYELEGPRVYQHAQGRKNVALRVGAAELVLVGGVADLTVRDAAGNVLRETKAERIREHTLLLDSMAPKLARSPTLRNLVSSYSRAVSDPANEFVHLYEIRDALSQEYGGEQNARGALGITKDEWQRVGELANAEPVEQGRHRGKHLTGRRVATADELQEARSMVRRWIVTFGDRV